jgi:hypothetical protein
VLRCALAGRQYACVWQCNCRVVRCACVWAWRRLQLQSQWLLPADCCHSPHTAAHTKAADGRQQRSVLSLQLETRSYLLCASSDTSAAAVVASTPQRQRQQQSAAVPADAPSASHSATMLTTAAASTSRALEGESGAAASVTSRSVSASARPKRSAAVASAARVHQWQHQLQVRTHRAHRNLKNEQASLLRVCN